MSWPALSFAPGLSLIVVASLAAAGCGWIDKAAAKDTKVIVYSAGPATSVAIDGGEPFELEAGKFQSFAVGPGTHALVFDGERKVSVTLEAFDRWVVPAIDEQCFFSIDVGSSHYSVDGENRLGGPDIAKRQQQSEAFKFPANHYLTEKELPNEVASGTLLYMLRSLPCAQIERLQAGLAGEPEPDEGGTEPGEDPVVARLAAFSAAIACDAPTARTKPWCEAASAWIEPRKDGSLPLVEGGASYVGLRVELGPADELATALDRSMLSVLAIRPIAGGSVGYLDGVKPESDDEQVEVSAAVASAAAVLAGEAAAVELPESLAAYVDSLPASAATPVESQVGGWSLGEGVELRPVGTQLATVRPTADGGLELAIHVPRAKP